MKNSSLVHIKVYPEELSETKRNFLLTEANLIKVLQSMKKYHESRMQELSLKEKLLKKLKVAKLEIKNTERNLPNPKIPEILQGEKTGEEYIYKKNSNHKDDLEYQLMEIQKKLKELER